MHTLLVVMLALLLYADPPPNCAGVEPNGLMTAAVSLWRDAITTDSLSYLDWSDWFVLSDVTENIAYNVAVVPITARTDTYVRVVNRDGGIMTTCDDYNRTACNAGSPVDCGCTAYFTTTSLPVYLLVTDWQEGADYACHNYLVQYQMTPSLLERVYLPMIKHYTCPGCTPTQ